MREIQLKVAKRGKDHPCYGTKQTELNKQRTREANKKTYHLDFNGQKFVTDDLPDFAGRNGFNKDTIRNYSRRGDRLKGWIIEYTVSATGEKYVYGTVQKDYCARDTKGPAVLTIPSIRAK
jgi:hypothetical protein